MSGRSEPGSWGYGETRLAALVLAPLVPLLIYWACAPSPDLDSLVATLLVGAFAVTYPCTIAVGLPAYVLITKYAILRLWHVLAISAATGAAAGILFAGRRCWAPPPAPAPGSRSG